MPKQVFSPVIRDEIELCNADGSVAKTVPYRIDALKSYKSINEKREALRIATQAQDYPAIGRLFLDLLREVFGDAVTSELLQFFDAQSDEEMSNMVWILTPIMVDEIFPALERMRAQVVAYKRWTKRYNVH